MLEVLSHEDRGIPSQYEQASFSNAGLQQQQTQLQDRPVPQRKLSDLQPEVHQQVWTPCRTAQHPAA